VLCCSAMNCPSCNRVNLPAADKCDCGYVLKGPQTDPLMHLGSIDRSLRTIKTILVLWLVLAMVGVVIGLIVTVASVR